MGINEEYLKLLRDVYTQGKIVMPRGFECRELLGYRFELSDICNNNIITLPGVETNIDYAKEELRWYLAGDPHINFSPRIKRVWERFSDDGEHVNSNYGERMFGRHSKIPTNQWEWVKNELIHDPDSRRAVIVLNAPFDKELVDTKDFVCTLGIQYFIRDNKLDCVVSMRSNDVFKGFRNDIYCFGEFQKMMAKELGKEPGRYIHFAGSMHAYATDYEKIDNTLKSKEIK